MNRFNRIVPARFVAQYQRRHVWCLNILPALGTLAAVALIPWFPPGPTELLLFLMMWALTLGLGGTVGFHRLFAHRAFETYSGVKYILAILGHMAAVGPVISWVATHRRHHERSDMEGDPHSPIVPRASETIAPGLWHAHAGWLWRHDMPNPLHYAPDLMSDRILVQLSRLYYYWVILGIALPVIIGGLIHGTWSGLLTTFLWIGPGRLFVTSQLVSSINSICHKFGSRRYATDDCSQNNVWLALPTFGEAWHNNHHAFPTSAAFGHKCWELDLGWIAIWALKSIGLAWNVRLPKTTTAADTRQVDLSIT